MSSSQVLTHNSLSRINSSDEGGLNLGLVLKAIQRQAFLILGITLTTAGLGAWKASRQVPIYSAQFEILTEPITVETEVISSVSGTLASRETPETVDATKIRVLTSNTLLLPVFEQLKTEYPNLDYGTLKRNLSIRIGETNILAVTYSHSDPKLVQDVLEKVADRYLQYSLEERQADVSQGSQFVEEQLPSLRMRVQSLQEELQKIRQENNLVDPLTKGEQLTTQLATFESEKLTNQVELDVLIKLYENLQQEIQKTSPEIAAASALKENPQYQNILNQIQAIDVEIAQQKVTFNDNSFQIRSLYEKRQNLTELLQREVERVERETVNRIRELAARQEAISNNIENLNREVKQLSEIIRNYSDIERELQIATDNLNQFLIKRDALRIDTAQREIPWNLLSPVSEPSSSVPGSTNSILLGAALGLFLGTGLALIKEQFTDVVYSSSEIRYLTQLPLLGIIPFQKQLKETVELNLDPKDNPESIKFQEAFHSLCVNILLINQESPISSVIVSSSTALEGKSTVSVHLAQAAAKAGRRVLLIDTDLRHPSLHERLSLENQVGLTDTMLANFNPLAVGEAVEEVSENLFVLTVGSQRPDPIKFLASSKMENLKEYLHENFDLVIYDAPPINGLADVNLLAVKTDGVLLVTGLGQLKRSALGSALDEVKTAGISILGVVANKAKGETKLTYYLPNDSLKGLQKRNDINFNKTTIDEADLN